MHLEKKISNNTKDYEHLQLDSDSVDFPMTSGYDY